MKKIIQLENIVEEFKSRRQWFDRLTFLNIFLLWTGTIVFFGLFYYFFSGNASNLIYPLKKETVNSLSDSIYFSFITATTTGFGDIVPIGYFKAASLVEVVFGLLLLALVTSKLVSIKQDIILGEIYEISFKEKISRLRSSFLLFRQTLGRLISKIEDSSIKKREITEIYIHLSNLEDTLNESITLILQKPEKNRFIKVLDPVNTELILNSILHSFEKIHELVVSLNPIKAEWKRETTVYLLDKCILLSDKLFDRYALSTILNEQTAKELESRKNKIISSIKDEVANDLAK